MMGDSVFHPFKVFGTNDISASFERPRLEAFLDCAKSKNLKIAVVTSGGTSVPLERRAVRYLENFSTGTRGAKSAENFLKKQRRSECRRLDSEHYAYAVIFLYRKSSKLPFLHDVSSEKIANTSQVSGSEVKFRDELVAAAVKSWKETQNRLFFINYTTVQEYLFNLFAIAETVRPFGNSVLFFLAAAVSDFYIPDAQLSEHKIQSLGDNLVISLQRVPKCLGLLRREWAPEAFIVSFKLETDSGLLAKKSKAALAQYGVHCVIGNLLNSRYQEVVVFDSHGSRVLTRTSAEECLEVSLVQEIANMHERHAGDG